MAAAAISPRLAAWAKDAGRLRAKPTVICIGGACMLCMGLPRRNELVWR